MSKCDPIQSTRDLFELLEPRVLLSHAWVFEPWEEFLPAGAEYEEFSDIQSASNYESFWTLSSEAVWGGGDTSNYFIETEGWLALGDDLLTPDNSPWLVDSMIFDVRGDFALARQFDHNNLALFVEDWMILNLRTGEKHLLLDAVPIHPSFNEDYVEQARFMGPDNVVFWVNDYSWQGSGSGVYLHDGDSLDQVFAGVLFDVSDAGYILGGETNVGGYLDSVSVWSAALGATTPLPGEFREAEVTSRINANGQILLLRDDGALVTYDFETGETETIAVPDPPIYNPPISSSINSMRATDIDDLGRVIYQDNTHGTAGRGSFSSRWDRELASGDAESAAIAYRLIGLEYSSYTGIDTRFGFDGNLYLDQGRLVSVPLVEVLRSLGPASAYYDDTLVMLAQSVFDSYLLLDSGLGSSDDIRAIFGAHDEIPLGAEIAIVADPLADSSRHFVLFTTAGGSVLSSVRDGSRTLKPIGFYEDPFMSIASSPTGFTTADGHAVFAGLSQSGELFVVFSEEPGSIPLVNVNLSTDHLAERELETPEFASNLISYSTPWGGQNIAGLNAEGEVEIVWWAPGVGDLWMTNNISKEIGAPKLVGNISAVATEWESINIVGTDADGTAWMLHWAPSYGAGNWQVTNLTEASSGAALQAGSLTAHVTGWNGLVFSGIEKDTGRVVSYWWEATIDRWIYEVLAPDQTALVGALSSAASRNEQSIVGVAEDGSLIRYWSNFTGGWHVDNLSELAVI